METARFNLSNLRNEEHFQYQSEFKALVVKFGAKTIGIDAAFDIYLTLYAREDMALDVVRKSAATKLLDNADKERDKLFRGFADAVKSAQNHFNADKRSAGKRIGILVKHYGNIARKSYDQATAAITLLVDKANTEYPADIATLELSGWIAEIDAKNKEFSALMMSRNKEGAAKTDIRMTEARKEVDDSFRAIADRLDALMILNEPASCEPFVCELNVCSDRFKTILAQRQGRAKKAGRKKKEAKENEQAKSLEENEID